MKTTKYHRIALMSLAGVIASLGILTGCVAGSGYGSTRVQADVIVDDDYMYYPDYEIYYSNRHHNYVYRDGGRWVTRSAPPRIGADILVASPSVHVDFHDSPEHHHAEVIKSYPKHWRPAGHSNEVRKDDRENERKEERKERKPGHKDDRDDDDRKRS